MNIINSRKVKWIHLSKLLLNFTNNFSLQSTHPTAVSGMQTGHSSVFRSCTTFNAFVKFKNLCELINCKFFTVCLWICFQFSTALILLLSDFPMAIVVSLFFLFHFCLLPASTKTLFPSNYKSINILIGSDNRHTFRNQSESGYLILKPCGVSHVQC